jgi:hypothetical protein
MDAIISEVVVTLDRRWEHNLPGAVRKLKHAGMTVWSADDDASVVEGAIDTHNLHALERLDCVRYVRTVFTYHANYPPGDPRDRDGI